jgi:DNA-binding HxlR family transcriptional regulator
VVERGMEGVGESRGISEEVLASLREMESAGGVERHLFPSSIP